MCPVFQPVTALACLKSLCLAWHGFVLHSSASHKGIIWSACALQAYAKCGLSWVFQYINTQAVLAALHVVQNLVMLGANSTEPHLLKRLSPS